jgi:hypothetical protein
MQLLENNVGIDLTLVDHLQLNLIDALGQTYTYSTTDQTPAIQITGITTGIVEFTPPTAQILQYIRSPYKFFWWVFVSSTEKYSVPSKGNGLLMIDKEF